MRGATKIIQPRLIGSLEANTAQIRYMVGSTTKTKMDGSDAPKSQEKSWLWMGKSITRKCWNEKKRAGAKKDRGQRRRGEILRSEVCWLRSSCNFWGKPRAAPDRPTISRARASGQPALGDPRLLALVHVVLQLDVFSFRNDQALIVSSRWVLRR